MTNYVLIHTEKTFCSNCQKPLVLLQAKILNPKRAMFYICFPCQYIGQVGKGQVPFDGVASAFFTLCPVRNHGHQLTLIREVTQTGTGAKLDVLECPTGRYRWLVPRGKEVSNNLRMTRPRFGWKPE